jgi:hypothetical protein
MAIDSTCQREYIYSRDLLPIPRFSLSESFMPPGQKYICQSKDCRREIELEIPTRQTVGEISNPKCICGSKMKKVYSKPVLTILSIADRKLSSQRC